MSTVTGVQGEERHEYTTAESRHIRRRSLRLLGSLLHPLRVQLWLTMAIIVVSTAAQVAGPAIIAYGIDQGLRCQRAVAPRPMSDGSRSALLIAT